MVVELHASSGTGGGGGGSSDAPDVTPYRGTASAVPPQSLTTVVSRVVPLGFTFKLYGALVSSNTTAEWVLFDNGSEVFRQRIAAGDLLEGRANALSFPSGHTVELKVEHADGDLIGGSTSRNFQATLLGRDA